MEGPRKCCPSTVSTCTSKTLMGSHSIRPELGPSHFLKTDLHLQTGSCHSELCWTLGQPFQHYLLKDFYCL